MNFLEFENRKQNHLDLALDPRVQTLDLSGLNRVILKHDALPDLDLSDIRLTLPFRKGKLATPFFISGMTAGHAAARLVNERLAKACARRGWIFGVGSQRRDLESKLPVEDGLERLKFENPGLVLIGNIGISQAIHASVQDVKKINSRVSSDALAIHLNALQEAIQPEGTPFFRGSLESIRKLSKLFPLIVKETGCGFSEKTLKRLKLLPLVAVDVSGVGGTHWGRIEGLRARSKGDELRAQTALTFSDWGNSTVESVIAARKTLPKTIEVWASGGVRSGLDAAKLLGLGATRVGFAKPALEAALVGDSELDQWMEKIEFELKTALFCLGYESPKALSQNGVKNGDVRYV